MLTRFLNKVPKPGFVVGREELLQKIQLCFSSGQNVLLIHGIGGIGKTVVALEFAHHPSYGDSYAHVAYLEVTDKIEYALAASERLHKSLGLTESLKQIPPEHFQEMAAREVLSAIRDLDSNLLLVIDNLNDRNELLNWQKVLKDLPVDILITSRAEVPGLRKISVTELSHEHALDVFLNHFGLEREQIAPDDIAVIHEILNEIEYHTLLIEMVAAIGREARYSFSRLRNYIREKYISHRDLQWTIPTGEHGESKGMPESKITDYLKFLFADIFSLQVPEKEFLCCLAALPEKEFSEEELLHLFQIAEEGHTKFLDSVSQLHKKGIPLIHNEGYRLHRLVRTVVLEYLHPDMHNCAPVIRSVTDLLDIDQTKRYYPAEKIRLLDLGTSLLENITWEHHLVHIQLLKNVGKIYFFMGNYDESVRCYEKALSIGRLNPDENNEVILDTQHELAIQYKQLGKYEESVGVLVEVISKGIDLLGIEHPNVAAWKSSLASVYHDMHQYEPAARLFEESLQANQQQLHTSHLTIAASQLNLGVVYRKLGKFQEAKELLEKSLQTIETIYEPEHPAVAVRLNNLAFIKEGEGDLNGAKEFFLKAYTIYQKNFGTDHPQTQVILNNYNRLMNFEANTGE